MEPEKLQQAHGRFDWSSLTLFLLSIAAVMLCGLIAWPFLSGITGAVVLAIVTQRPHRWLARRIRNASLAATISLVLVIISIVVPTTLIVLSAGNHILNVARGVQSGAAVQEFRQFMDRHDRIAGMLQYTIDNVDLSQAVQKSAGVAAGRLAFILGQSVGAFAQIIVMLFILFFLFRDPGEVLGFVRLLMPLEEDEKDYLLQRIRTAVQALVLGRFAVAGFQGLLAGIAYAALGVSGATLLGVLTMFTALVPAVGAFVIWLPIVIYLALIHHWIQAVILLGVGALIISTADNVLYPILVGSRLRLHTVPIFISMLGGVWFFGVTGLILGPITFTVTGSLMLIWRRRTTGEPLPFGPVL